MGAIKNVLMILEDFTVNVGLAIPVGGQFDSAITIMQKLSNLIFLNIDVDECIDSNGGCAQICNNTVGSFTCRCNEGYLLNCDEISCDGK